MGRFFYWCRVASFSYLVKLILIYLSLKTKRKVPRVYKITLELMELCRKQRTGIKILNDFVFITWNLNTKPEKFLLRWGTSDILVFKQLIVNHELSPVVKFFESRGYQPKTMIDAGTNIGLASMYLRAFWPNLNCVCLEPDHENVHILNKNLSGDHIVVFPRALWYKDGLVSMVQGIKGDFWGIRTVESKVSSDNSIPAVKLSTLVKELRLEKIDYLKIDIEGAEEEIFYNDPTISNALNEIACISIEPHTVDFRQYLLDYLPTCGFVVVEKGELVIGVKNNL